MTDLKDLARRVIRFFIRKSSPTKPMQQECEYEYWRSNKQYLRGECFTPDSPCRTCAAALIARSKA